jgi:hypothetical protein
MALTISQIAAVSYEAVVSEMRDAQNQWAENAVLNKFEASGMIVRKSFGPTLEETIDYRRNPAADFLATDLQPTSTTKTEVLTAASYTPAELSVPVTWSKRDEMQNPTENQKISLTKGLLENGINSHDDLIEEKLFATSAYNGFNTFNVIIPTTGQGTVGGIDASVETMWRNKTGTYLADGSDIEAQFTQVWNDCSKGSGSALSPKLMWSGSTPHALFESTLQPLQRFEGQEAKAGFRVLQFKTAGYIFSQYGGSKVYMGGPKCIRLLVSKQYFRDKGDTQELQDANGFNFKIYSGLQLVTGNKSRLGVLDAA